MKALNHMSTDEKLIVWADHMIGIKENKELKDRGISLK